MESRLEQFVADANRVGYDVYRKSIEGSGTFEYRDVVDKLIELENKLNSSLLGYLFGEQLGEHYAKVFTYDCHRSITKFMGKMDSEKMFFLLHELKTNEALYAHC